MLRKSRVFVAGCGGIGCYALEFLARLGVGEIAVADGDVFVETNLNRQLFSKPSNVGETKVSVAKKRIFALDPTIRVFASSEPLKAENASQLLSGCDLAIDGLDNVEDRLILADFCGENGIYMVHGAVNRHFLQVSAIKPKSGDMAKIYSAPTCADSATLAYMPAMCASIQTSEAIKILCGHAPDLAGKLLVMDFSDYSQTIIEL